MTYFRLTFAEVDAALAMLHSVPAEHRTAFTARLRNFIRLGLVPIGHKGRRARLGPEEILRIALATELAQSGIRPEYIVGVIETMWPTVWGSIQAIAEKGEAIYLFIRPRLLSSADLRLEALDYGLVAKVEWLRAPPASAIIVDLRTLTVDLSYEIGAVIGGSDRTFRNAIVDERLAVGGSAKSEAGR